MRFTFIGTGTAAPSALLHPSAVCFDLDGYIGLLDIGAGAVHRMFSMGIDPIDIENIFLSHFHSDHVSDLIMLMHSNNATPGKTRQKPLNLYGPAGLKYLAETLNDLFPETVPENYELNIFEITGRGPVSPAPGISLSCCKTGHTDYSLAYRFFSGDRSFVYTGDCAYSSALTDFCKWADVLITECSYTDESRTEDHLCVSEAGAFAKEAGVGNLVITHRYPRTAEQDIASEIGEQYKGSLFIPSEGDTLSFG